MHNENLRQIKLNSQIYINIHSSNKGVRMAIFIIEIKIMVYFSVKFNKTLVFHPPIPRPLSRQEQKKNIYTKNFSYVAYNFWGSV